MLCPLKNNIVYNDVNQNLRIYQFILILIEKNTIVGTYIKTKKDIKFVFVNVINLNM